MVLATALMYLRVGVLIGIFNLPLALSLAPWLGGLFAMGLLLAALVLWRGCGRRGLRRRSRWAGAIRWKSVPP